jgi:hypothetical protein
MNGVLVVTIEVTVDPSWETQALVTNNNANENAWQMRSHSPMPH